MADAIVERDGLLWLNPEELTIGVRDKLILRDFEMFDWDGKTYELQGRDAARDLWWVEEVRANADDAEYERVFGRRRYGGRGPRIR